MIASTVIDVAWLVLACAALALVLIVGVLVARRGLDRFTLRGGRDGVELEVTGVQSIERTVRSETAAVRESLDEMRSSIDARFSAMHDRMDRYERQNSREHAATAVELRRLAQATAGLTARLDGVEDAMTAPGGV